MDVTPLIPEGRQMIQSYAGGGFKVTGKSFQGAIAITPEKTLLWDVSIDTAKDITEAHITAGLEGHPESDILLLGAGAVSVFISPDLRARFRARGITIDVMDTGAACRTYNVLMIEGRRVIALLLPFQTHQK